MKVNVMDLAREYFPDSPDAELEFFLWEYTAFPFNSIEGLREQLQDLKDRGEAVIAAEIEAEYEDMHRQLREQEKEQEKVDADCAGVSPEVVEQFQHLMQSVRPAEDDIEYAEEQGDGNRSATDGPSGPEVSDGSGPTGV